MNALLKELLLKVAVGHAGSAGGGALIVDAINTDSRGQLIAGLVAILMTAGHSAFRKWRRNRAAKKVAG